MIVFMMFLIENVKFKIEKGDYLKTALSSFPELQFIIKQS